MIQFFSKKIRNKKGFTLIELIVVIAILGALVAIAVPRFGGFSRDAQDVADKATARTILSAVTMAEADTNGGTINVDDINKFLNEDIKIVTTEPGPDDGWTVWFDNDTWNVYKGDKKILPEDD